MKWILFVLVFCSLNAYSQEDTSRYQRYATTYGMQVPRMWASKVFRLPDTSRVNALGGALGTNPAKSELWLWNGENWSLIRGGGGSGTSYTGGLWTNITGSTIKSDSAAMAAYFLRRKDSGVNYVTPFQLGEFIPLSGTVSGKPVTGDINIQGGETNFISSTADYSSTLQFVGEEGALSLTSFNKATSKTASISVNSLSEPSFNGVQVNVGDPLSRGLYGAMDYSGNYDPYTYVQRIYSDKNLDTIYRSGDSLIVFKKNGTRWGIYSPTSTGGGGTGTVSTISVTTANGISGTVANASTTPAITLNLDATRWQTKAATKTTSDSVVALIPTNNNTLTNGAGYITSSSLSPYLASITAATTYFPVIGGTLTGTTNTGFIGFQPQTTAMAVPLVGFKLYDSSGFTILRNDGFRRVLSFQGINANVKFNFPTSVPNDTLTTNTAPQTLSNKTIAGTSNIISSLSGSNFSSQSAFTLFGRGSSSGAPSFLASIDSNWIPALHTKAYYDGLYAPISSSGWSLSGNTATAGSSTGSFIGTTNLVSLRMKTNNVERLMIDSINGNVGIGLSPNFAYRLDVSGALRADNLYSTNGAGFIGDAGATSGMFFSSTGTQTNFKSFNGVYIWYRTTGYQMYYNPTNAKLVTNLNAKIVSGQESSDWDIGTTSTVKLSASVGSDLEVRGGNSNLNANGATTAGNLLLKGGYHVSGNSTSTTNGYVSILTAPSLIGNTPVERFRVTQRGNILAGTTTEDSTALLNLSSTVKGLLIPRMTTTQRDAIPSKGNGLVVYNTSTGTFDYWNSSAWVSLGTSTPLDTTFISNRIDYLTSTKDDKLNSFSSQTASYTLALADQSKLVEIDNTSATTFTVPLNATTSIPVGFKVDLMQTNTGQITITPASGVTLLAPDGYLKTRVRYSSASLVKKATDTWYVVGDLSL